VLLLSVRFEVLRRTSRLFTEVSTSSLITLIPTKSILTKFGMEIFQRYYGDVLKWNSGPSSFNVCVSLSLQLESKGKRPRRLKLCTAEEIICNELSFAITSYLNCTVLNVRMSGESQECTNWLRVQDPVSVCAECNVVTTTGRTWQQRPAGGWVLSWPVNLWQLSKSQVLSFRGVINGL
jgi:hypothetical protein